MWGPSNGAPHARRSGGGRTGIGCIGRQQLGVGHPPKRSAPLSAVSAHAVPLGQVAPSRDAIGPLPNPARLTCGRGARWVVLSVLRVAHARLLDLQRPTASSLRSCRYRAQVRRGLYTPEPTVAFVPGRNVSKHAGAQSRGARLLHLVHVLDTGRGHQPGLGQVSIHNVIAAVPE